MKRARAAITIRDVAEEAGVSVSTVSRVLNDKDDVAAETYARVQDVIRELGYTSSLAAKSMRSRRTNVIGLIVPDVEDSFSIQVMKGVNHAITELDYDLLIYTSGSIKKRSAADRERHFVALLNGSITDGIIIVTPATTSFSTAAPVVAVDPNKQSPDVPAIIATNRRGAMSAMGHLFDLGHRRIAYIGGRPDLQSAQWRLQGYRDALERAHLPLDPDLVAVGDFSAGTGCKCARQLLSLPQPPTAILAANDQSAFGAMQAARDLGLSVPHELSVVGFDNIPEAAYSDPALTTVDQFVDKMGAIAAQMLVDLVEGRTLDSLLYEMPTQLVIRDSCRALESSA